MKELITIDQANVLMYVVLIAAPVIGLAVGAAAKRWRAGLLWGIGVGVGNLILWKVYNVITDRLGLDSVKNLLVNLGLFIAVGLIGGFLAGKMGPRAAGGNSDATAGAGVALAGAPSGGGAGAARTFDEADERPRQAG